jgi:hypothetical protein
MHGVDSDSGAVRRCVEVEQAVLYVDPILAAGHAAATIPGLCSQALLFQHLEEEGEEPPHAEVCAIRSVVTQVAIPDLGSVLCASCLTPGGKKRRVTISGVVAGLKGHLQPAQMHHFVFHLLHVFYGGAYRAWRAALIQKHREEGCRRLREEEREYYMFLDRQLQMHQTKKTALQYTSEHALPDRKHPVSSHPRPGERRELRQNLAALEEVMHFAEIVDLRCQAREWNKHGLLTTARRIVDGLELSEVAARSTSSVEEELRIDEFEPVVAEFSALALCLAHARAQYTHENKSIREIFLESVRIEDIEVSVAGIKPSFHQISGITTNSS